MHTVLTDYIFYMAYNMFNECILLYDYDYDTVNIYIRLYFNHYFCIYNISVC